MKPDRKIYLRLGITVAAVYLLIRYWEAIAAGIALIFHAAAPLILGAVVAYAVNILMSVFERIYFPKSKKKAVVKSRLPVCILLSYLCLIGMIGLIIGLIVPELANCVKVLIAKIPPLMQQCSGILNQNEQVSRLLNEFGTIAPNGTIDWENLITKAVDWMAGSLGGAMGVVGNVITATFSTTFNIIMSIIFSLYLLAGKKKIICQIKRTSRAYIRKDIFDKIQYVLHVLNECFHNFIVGQCLEAVILGSLCAIGLMILRMPYSGMIGALIGFTALIPVAGAYIGGAVGFLMIATESPLQAVGFVIFLVILQQVEGQLIYPRVVGASIGLPGIWVLTAVTIGGSVMGISGMLLFVPLASAAYKLLRDDVNRRNKETEENKGIPEKETEVPKE